MAERNTHAVLAALRGLTTRGWCFLTGGLACLLSATVLGLPDLIRVAFLLILLPLIAAAFVARTRYRLQCTRTLLPNHVVAEGEARVRIQLDNVSRLTTSVLLIEDQIPYQVGLRPRFVLDRIESGGRRVLEYLVQPPARGRYPIGPLSVRLTDPFGLCELTRSFTATNDLLVTPPIWALPGVRLGGEWAGSTRGHFGSLATTAQDDVVIREYQSGDDLRRVHWRATARAGSLMVRREEQPWHGRASLLLDNRARGHLGVGASPRTSSFEWAVAATGSLADLLQGAGYLTRVFTATGDGMTEGLSPGQPGTGTDVQALLAGVTLTDHADLARPASELIGERGAVVVAVLGSLDADSVLALTRRHPGSGRQAIAVLLDTGTWSGSSPRERTHAEHELGRHRDLLTLGGWRVIVAGRTTSLAEALSTDSRTAAAKSGRR
jgi:uncharacterized protein (DUF58 family)